MSSELVFQDLNRPREDKYLLQEFDSKTKMICIMDLEVYHMVYCYMASV